MSWIKLPCRFRSEKQPFTFDAAMRRLFYLLLLGGIVAAVYGGLMDTNPGLKACTAVMLGFSAALGAGLIGFIFGVPFARDSKDDAVRETAVALGVDGKRSAPTYRPNTSLEQIADWLTKILVGVGLVEMQQAPYTLHRLVLYLTPGLGQGPQAEAFVTAVLIFFSVSGFLFGFLWARLYLRRWLIDVDGDLIEKLSRFDADAKAYSLTTRQLERHEDEDEVSSDQLDEAISKASSTARARIFDLAKAASEDWNSSDYAEIKNPGAESIFRALIKADTRSQYHNNHGELGYVLGRRRPPELSRAIDALSEAIARRDAMHVNGWRYYEFRRALNRILQEEEKSKAGQKTDPPTIDLIQADLAAACRNEPERFEKWCRDHAVVKPWMTLNGVNLP